MKNKKKPFFGAGRQKLIPTAGREEREDSFQFENQFNLNNFFSLFHQNARLRSRDCGPLSFMVFSHSIGSALCM
jgi:hypothetical protein